MRPALAIAAALLTAAAPAAAPAAAAAAVETHLGEIEACLPQPDGTVVATLGGLVALDPGGAPRAVWTALDGLPGTRIHALRPDGAGYLVGGEAGAAAVSLDGDRLRLDRVIASKPVRDLVRHDGALYLATWGDGLVRVAAGARRGIRVRQPGADRARLRGRALAIHAGDLWLASDAGLYRLVRGRLVPVALDGEPPEVHALASDGDRLLVATTAGLFAIADGAARRVLDGDVRWVGALDGRATAAVLGAGLVALDGDSVRALPGAPAGLVAAVGEAGGRACAGGPAGLWLRPAAGAPWRRAVLPGPPSNDLSALAADGDRLWLGTFDRGLALRDGAGRHRAIEHPALDRRINALALGRAGRLWVATAAGLCTVDGDGARVTRIGRREGLPSRNVLAVAALRDGRVLVGTTLGAALIDGGRIEALGKRAGVSMGNVWAVAEDDGGYLWLGTTSGLYRGRPGGDFRRLSRASGELGDDWVTALATESRTLWAGTYKGGVIRIDWSETGDDVRLTARPLGGGWINPGGLAWIDGTLHAATMEGHHIGDGESAAWRPGGALPGADTTAVAAVGDRLVVATRRGLVERPR
jgi:ligand-binding sensor domain-containing protein